MKYQQVLGILTGIVILTVGSVYSSVLYEWDFSSQADGTALSDVASSGTQASVNFSASAVAAGVAVTNGSLVMNWAPSTLAQAGQNTYADIVDMSSGTYWLVCQLDAVSMASDGAIFDVLFNKTGDTSGTVAGMRLRGVSGDLTASLLSSSTASVATLAQPTTTQITFAVELNMDTGKTQLLYKDGDNAWASSAEYDAISFTDVTHLRIRAGGFAAGDEIDVGTVYLTDVSPIPEPASLGLMIVAGSGILIFRRLMK